MNNSLRNISIVAALVGLFSCAFAQSPTTKYPVGVRQYNWMRGTRAITTYIYYPAASGTVGGAPVTNAPVAPGVFPICLFQHGYQSSPQKSLGMIQPLAEAGFIVPGVYLPNINIGDITNGEHPRDEMQVITNTIALNNAAPFTGQINTTQVAVSGHSMGGMIVNALLTDYPDSRIKAAIPMSCTRQGAPSSSVVAKVMFMHGDADTLCPYSSAMQSYSEMPAPKAFITWLNGGHTAMWGDPIMGITAVDWMRWALYGDTAARDRLPAEATSDHTTWQSVGVTSGSTTYYKLRNVATSLYVDGMGRTSNGSNCGQYASSTSNNQQWLIEAAGSYVKLRNHATSLYIDGAGSTTNGAAAVQWSSSTSNNQQWTQEAAGSNFKYRNRATGLYLDGMGRTSNGSDLGQWASSSSYNQQFTRVAP